jgi:hypothetical protein
MIEEKFVTEIGDKLFALVGEKLLEQLNWKQPVVWTVGTMVIASFVVTAHTFAKAKRVAVSQDIKGGLVYILVNMEGGALNEDNVEPGRVRNRLNEMLYGEPIRAKNR